MHSMEHLLLKGMPSAICFKVVGSSQDRRVVMRDSQQYVSALNAGDSPPEIRVIVFPNDTHALDLPQTEFEQWINAAWWLKRFI